MPVSVVTGATSGIGRWVARGLVRNGHHLVLIGRDPDRGARTVAWLRQQVPGAQAEMVLADLSSVAQTREAGTLIGARHPAIDLLVNNAGTFASRRQETPEGNETVIATNHLSPFALTRALVPALRRAAARNGGARIVNVGSSTSDRARIDPQDLNGIRRWGMVRSYSQSKLALMIATFGWSSRLAGTGVVANVVHPGAVATRLVRSPGVIGLAWRMMAPFLLTEEQGADTPLHVCLDPGFATLTGVYVKRRKPVAPNPRALDPVLQAQLWAATETLAGG